MVKKVGILGTGMVGQTIASKLKDLGYEVMCMAEIPRFWALLAASFVLFFVAAKFHGRQVRLERELAGHNQVTFGGKNPPFVALPSGLERGLKLQ